MSGSLLQPGSAPFAALTDDRAVLSALLAVEVAWVGVQHDLGATSEAAVAAVAQAATALVAASAPAAGDPVIAALAADAEHTGTPVVALVAELRERLGDDSAHASAAVHRGLTSQDVVDSALMTLARAVLDRMDDELRQAGDALAGLAEEHADTLCVGRTLGRPALPTTFGLTAAGWLTGLDEAAAGLRAVRDALPVQCGGAAGTLAAIDAWAPGQALDAAARLATRLGLSDPGRPWHTDRAPVTRCADAVVTVVDVLGRIAGDVLLLSRPEIGELAEIREPAEIGGSAPGPAGGGSSTLPQKRNPVSSVLVRSIAVELPHLAAGLHSASALAVERRPEGAWHAEWGAFLRLLDRGATAARLLARVVTELTVDTDAMARNVGRAGPALLGERILAAVTTLPDATAVAPRVRALLRSDPSAPDVIALLRRTLPEQSWPDDAVEDLLDPRGYLGAGGELVRRAVSRHAAGRRAAGAQRTTSRICIWMPLG